MQATPDAVLQTIDSLAKALEHAAASEAGMRIFDGRGKLAEETSYRALHQQALARATQLQALAQTHAWPRSAVVGLIAHTSLSLITDFLACQWAGLLPCLLPPPPVALGVEPYVKRTRHMLEAVRARALLLDAPHLPLLNHFAQINPQDLQDLQLVSTASLPTADTPTGLQPLQSDEAAYIQFSSGTTHAPKGIEISQRAICHHLNGILHAGLHITPDDRAFSWLPLHHDMGLVGFLLAPILGAVPLDLMPAQAFARRPQLWPKLMAELRSTICFAPSFAWGLAAQRTLPDDARQMTLSLRVAGVGGDMVREQDLSLFAERFAASGFATRRFHPCYGLAEATLAVSMGPATMDKHGAFTSGKPLPGWEVRIVDDAGMALSAPHTGRIQLRGPALMTGYWQQGHLSPIPSQAWLHTDDLGHFTPDGDLVVTGRQQSLLVIRGRNVHAEAIEAAVCAALHLAHGTVMAYQQMRPASSGLIVMLECPLKDTAQREQWMELARRAVFAVSGEAADIQLVLPRTVKMTTSGKIARQMTLDHVSSNGHD